MFKHLLTLILLTVSCVASAEICGKTDDRILSFDSKVGRLARDGETKGCAATLIGKTCVITSGNCIEKDTVEFNVPLSIAGVPQVSAPENRYAVIKSTIQAKSQGGIGDYWAVMRLAPNSVTGKMAGDVQGFYKVATHKYRDMEPVRVVQFTYALNDTDYVRDGVPARADGEVRHFAQQVSFGKLVKSGIFLLPEIIEHDADTSYGAAGSPVISEVTNEVLGINTHGGCQAEYVVKAGARYTNSGTSVVGSRGFRKAIESCLVEEAKEFAQ